jgi:hypothetical protein
MAWELQICLWRPHFKALHLACISNRQLLSTKITQSRISSRHTRSFPYALLNTRYVFLGEASRSAQFANSFCNHRNALETSCRIRTQRSFYANFATWSIRSLRRFYSTKRAKPTQKSKKEKKRIVCFLAYVSGACLFQAAGGGVRMNIWWHNLHLADAVAQFKNSITLAGTLHGIFIQNFGNYSALDCPGNLAWLVWHRFFIRRQTAQRERERLAHSLHYGDGKLRHLVLI